MLHPKRTSAFCLATFLVFLAFFADAQEKARLRAAEDSLRHLATAVIASGDDGEKMSLNSLFSGLLHETLTLDGSFRYPFDSLRTLGCMTSPDDKFRLYLWNLPLNTGTNTCYGFIQMKASKSGHSRIFALTDGALPDPEHEILDCSHWFGALYYRIIPFPGIQGETQYLLLGWNGSNQQVTSKVIDILSFNANGEPVFGARVFRNFREDNNTRVIFRYSASSTMTLRYQEKYPVTITARSNSGKAVRETKAMQAIVADRLVPLDPQLEGQFSHYVPSSELVDLFFLQNGVWNYLPEQDAMNSR